MALGIDDAAILAAEISAEATAEATAEVTAESVGDVGASSLDVIGDDVGENVHHIEEGMSNGEISDVFTDESPDVIGDDVGENVHHIEEGISNGEISDVFTDESPDVIGDGVGENVHHIEEGISNGEISNVFTDKSPDVIGDGVGENIHHIEEGISNGEISDVFTDESPDVIGDDVGESSIEDLTGQDIRAQDVSQSTMEDLSIENNGINDGVDSLSELKNCEVDDNGRPFMKDGERIPNNEYDLNDFHYTTDEYGRITKVEGSINQIPETTPRSAPPEVKDMAPGDDKGHIIALELGGADSPGNMVPMKAELNRFGDYRLCEREVKQAARLGKDVKVSIEMEYVDTSSRPALFHFTYEIDGEITERTFLNK